MGSSMDWADSERAMVSDIMVTSRAAITRLQRLVRTNKRIAEMYP